jgi:hypothetical protein
MARRRLLSDEQLAPFWAWASDERAIVRQYTLSRADLDLIAKKRTASNQLGFAVLMCGMRFPGRVLDVTETPPAAVLAFIADQVGVPPAQFATYRQRPTNRREHVAELMAILGCRAFCPLLGPNQAADIGTVARRPEGPESTRPRRSPIAGKVSFGAWNRDRGTPRDATHRVTGGADPRRCSPTCPATRTGSLLPIAGWSPSTANA